MIINDGVLNHNVNELKLNYVKLINNDLTFYFNDGTNNVIEITNVNNMTAAIDVILERMFRKLATTGAGTTGTVSSGIIYWLNCKNISNLNISTETITVDFYAGTSVNIVYENATEATKELEYITFIYNNADLTRFQNGKRILKVNPLYTTNVGLDVYKTYTEARVQALSGDVIKFERCNYETGTERFVLKNEVDIIFEDTNVIMNTYNAWLPPGVNTGSGPRMKPLISDEAEIIDCYVLGTLNLSVGISNLTGWIGSDIIRSGSKFYFAYNELKFTIPPVGITSWHHAYGNSRIWIKGNRATNSRIYDDDENLLVEYPDSCDYDMLYASTSEEAQGYIYLPYSNNCNWRIRNAYFSGELFTAYNENNSYRFINCKLDNNGLALHGVENLYYKQWRVLWKVGGTAVGGGNGIVEVENYNQSYSAGTVPAVELTEQNPAMIVDTGITIEPIILPDSLQSINELEGGFEGTDFVLKMAHVENAQQFDVYENNVLIDVVNVIKGQDFEYVIPEGSGTNEYKVKARNNITYTNSSNKIINTMELSNLPIPAKYNPRTVGSETVYALVDGTIRTLTVLEYEVEITNPLNNSTGVQKNKYRFTELPNLWLDESKVFASKNALLANLKGEYFFENLLLYEFQGGLGNNDYGGLNFNSFNFTTGTFDTHLTDSVLDGANLTGCVLDSSQDTKAEFAAAVKSYDKNTTIWTDGNPIGIVT